MRTAKSAPPQNKHKEIEPCARGKKRQWRFLLRSMEGAAPRRRVGDRRRRARIPIQGKPTTKPKYKQLQNGKRENGGADRDRTDDLNTASVALSQLSYSPT